MDPGEVLLKIYLTCDSSKHVKTNSAGVGLFLIPVQSDSAEDPC